MADRVPVTVDFETDKIESRPQYPPKPVGVAIRYPSGQRKYYAFGHPEGNNCHVGQARDALRDVYRSGAKVLFHNGSFDMDVADIHWGLRPPPPHRVEDTLYLSFLKNPIEPSISLKPLAAKYCGMPPDEQEDLRDWILANVPEAKRKKKEWGAYISEAPVHMVEPYALGDVDRTFAVWEKFRPEIVERGMLPAYERELQLTEATLEMERSGLRVDVRALKDALHTFESMDEDICKGIRRKLRVGKDCNINSGDQLADAMERAGKLDAVIRTPTGKISTRMVNLHATCNDKALLDLLAVHSVAEKYITSFMRPWLEQCERTGGRILPRFHQVRNRGDEGGHGARSGRYSSSDPNLQNVSANVEESQNKDTLLMMQKWLKEQYEFEFVGLRDYILPDEDSWMICVDYDQQELRLLAHFERGELMKAYLKNPKLDVHDYVRQMIHRLIGIDFPRKYIKVTVFGIIYGMGLEKLAGRIGESMDVAKKLREAVFEVVPGIPRMMKEFKRMARKDEPLVTWGGRQYYCEEPRYDKKRKKWMSFEYKMLNYQIQPSAADMTKQGMINVRQGLPGVRIAIQVHDELVVMAPNKAYGPLVAKAMCDIGLRVPVTATPKYSRKSWARAA